MKETHVEKTSAPAPSKKEKANKKNSRFTAAFLPQPWLPAAVGAGCPEGHFSGHRDGRNVRE